MKIIILHPRAAPVIDANQIAIQLSELDQIEQSSCVSIHLLDCLDYISFDKRFTVLKEVYSKLRKGGEITINGNDLPAIRRYIEHRMTSMEQLNNTLFNGKVSIDTLKSTWENLEKLGAEFVESKIDGMTFSVKARRPNV